MNVFLDFAETMIGEEILGKRYQKIKGRGEDYGSLYAGSMLWKLL